MVKRLWTWTLVCVGFTIICLFLNWRQHNGTLDFSFENIDNLNDIVKFSFNRDIFYNAIEQIDPTNISDKNIFFEFSNFEIEIIFSKNGTKILNRDLENNLKNNIKLFLESPSSIFELPPVLICDYIIFFSGFGDTRVYDELKRWRRFHFSQEDGTCQFEFSNFGSRNRDVGMVYKLINHLFLIKSISDGRIITNKKYDQLKNSEFMKWSINNSRLADYLNNNEKLNKNLPKLNSVKEFIKLLNPNIRTGLGIPSESDSDISSSYPLLFCLDLDTLVTNKSISINSVLDKIDDGLKYPPLSKNNKNKIKKKNINKSIPISDVDFIVATDAGCYNHPYSTLNAGVHLSRPSTSTVSILWFSLIKYGFVSTQDQGPLILALDDITDYENNELLKECDDRDQMWTNEMNFENRIVSVHSLGGTVADPPDPFFKNYLNLLNEERNKNIDMFWKRDQNYFKKEKKNRFVIILNGRWMNALPLEMPNNIPAMSWHPGDWIAHFVTYGLENEYGKRVREWVCDHLEYVSHPLDIQNCSNELKQDGFRFYSLNKKL